MAFFLASLNSGSDFCLRHLSEVNFFEDFTSCSHFWTCLRAKDFPWNSPCSHEIRHLIALAGPGNTIRVTCDIILICWSHRPYSLNTSSLNSRLKFFLVFVCFSFFFTDGFAYKIRNKKFFAFLLTVLP